MKLTTTLKFFLAVIALLALLCLIFPKNGIPLGGSNADPADSTADNHASLRFPTLHQVLVREKQKDIDSIISARPARDLTGALDTAIDSYQTLFCSHQRFWVPDDDVAFFDRFFASAEQAAARKQRVRIVHYGDSQIEMDRISSRIRERLQQVFGGGGPGMLPLRQPVPTITFNQNASGNIVGQSTWGDSTFVHNGNYGPMLRSWHFSGTASLSLSASKSQYATERVSHFSSLRILYNNRPGPLSVSATDRKSGAKVEASTSTPGIGLLSLQFDSATTSARLTFNGNADIYGIAVDDGYGIAVDNVGMRSVSGHQFRKVPLNQLAESYSLLDIGMIIMQFGGNSVPYLRSDKAIETYCRQIGQQIDHVRAACPQATIVFIGPSDMNTTVGGRLATYPKLPNVVSSLRDTALQHGAAFWSIFDAMGGQQSMIAWNSKGLAGSDYVHFTPKGAVIMGDTFSDALLAFYRLYTLRQHLTPQQFTTLWSQATKSAQQ